MKKYYRIMLGPQSAFANECFKGNFIGVNFDIDFDLSPYLLDDRKTFSKKITPIWLQKNPNKKKVSAGLSCSFLWTVTKGLNKGDIVFSPNGSGGYIIGEISGHYSYKHGANLPHQRPIIWSNAVIERTAMSNAFKNSTGSIGTLCDITQYAEEIEALITEGKPPIIVSTDISIEDAAEFVLEKHLEDFLVQNWKQTDLGKRYDIYEEDGELAGRQYPTDTGDIDILAISKDKKELLVVELKKGRASDSVIGQIQRYMGYVLEELAEKDQIVKGVIIVQSEDARIKRALLVTTNIDFYRYQISFKLSKV